MKIGILTFVGTQSHGACLQAYALKTALENMKKDAEIINYHCAKIDEVRTSKLPSNATSLKKLIGAIVKYPIYIKRWEKFDLFEKEYLKLSKIVTRNEIPNLYDKIIVGSDQIWNSDITGNDYTYFLDNISESKCKLSYAASLGTESFKSDEEEKCLRLISKFYSVNVREENFKQYLSEKINKDISCVIDPTLIIDFSIWNNLAMDKPLISESYVFVHAPIETPETWDIIYQLAEKKRLKIVYQTNSIKFKKGCKCLFSVSPIEYMNYIKFASFVVTGSFHTLSFSLIFGKQFLCTDSMVKSRNSRILNLLEITGCEDRTISSISLDNIYEIDYEAVNKSIKNAAEFSRSKLQEMLK